MKEIWEEHSTRADPPPREASIDSCDSRGRYKSSSQGIFLPEDALCLFTPSQDALCSTPSH